MFREAGLGHFGVVLWLFGSRLNGAERCGDIDVVVFGGVFPQEVAPRRVRFCAGLHFFLGDRPIKFLAKMRNTLLYSERGERGRVRV